MIIIAGSIPVDRSKDAGLLAAVNAVRTATLAEDGCAEYRFSFAADDPGTLLVFEEWRDADSLAAHAKSAHLADFRSKIAGLVTGQPNINKFDASNKGPLR